MSQTEVSPAIEGKVTPFEYKFTDTNGQPAGSFEGYGAVFSFKDDYGDVIAQGAFKSTLAVADNTGKMPKMLLNHGGLPWGTQTAESILPVGKWDSLSEDTRGLYSKGRLINLDTESGKRLYGAMKEGTIDSMSITYRAKEFMRGAKATDPKRTITNLDLIEVGPVTFPANDLATINEVKSFKNIKTIREFEDFLRDVGGFSHTAAKAIAASGYKAKSELRDEDESGTELAALFKRAAEMFNPK